MVKNKYSYYPSIEDKDFYKKIFLKKEFNKTKITKLNETNEEFLDRVCNPTSFRPLPQQDFLRNYISINTPYNGIIIFHGTGAGKTCAAVGIAEGFKKVMKRYHKKILVLAGQRLTENFINTVYNINKEENKLHKDDIVQCTGKKYELKSEDKYLTKEQQIRKIRNNILKTYKLMGYLKFANYVKLKTNWNGKMKNITDKVKKIIDLEFSNRIIIIDEVHNIKSTTVSKETQKTVPPILEAVIKYSNNKRIILMSATPMHDSPKEIVYLLNLMLMNDNRELIKETDIFDKDEYLTEVGIKILEDKAKGYISYIRGNNPISFPVKVYPTKNIIPGYKYDIFNKIIENKEKIKYSSVFPAYMSDYQFKIYNEILDKYKDKDTNKFGGIMDDLTQISNVVFPTKTSFTYGLNGFKKSNDGNGSFFKILKNIPGTNKKLSVFKYQSHVISNIKTKDEKPFLDKDLIGKYSIKMKLIMDNVLTAKGPIFIYSSYKSSGVIPIALMLEQNGFERYTIEGETQLLNYPFNKKGGGGKSEAVSYLNGLPISHKKNKNKNTRIAKYILITGDSDICKMSITQATNIINSESNKDGRDVKIILGTRVVGEGIDFKNIRQVHVLEPWYNFSVNRQIIGRAIRNCSHITLPINERNVEIYQYASLPPIKSKKKIKDTETIDEKRFRYAENKDIKIKDVEHVLKRVAVDCNLFKNANIFDKKLIINILTSTNIKKKINLMDKPYSSECDYKKECNYECIMKIDKKYEIDTDTYNIKYAETDINDSKKLIRIMYKLDFVYKLDDIVDYIKNKIPYIENMFIYKALDDLLKLSNEYIEDKYNRNGKLIYRGDYYIFQPTSIVYQNIPYYYRIRPLTVKPKYIEISTLITQKKEIDNKDELYKNNYETLEKKLLTKINKIINISHKYISEKINTKLMDIIIEYVLIRLNNINKLKILKYLVINRNKINNNLLINILNNKKFINNNTIILNNKKYSFDTKKKIWNEYNYNNDNNDNNNNKKLIYSEIYGFIEFNKSNKVVFKIIDKSKDKNTITQTKEKSMRSIITGRSCNTHRITQLINICNKIGYKFKIQNKKKNELCIVIELIFRLKNMDNNIIWFLDKTIKN
jgi:hypothetical protein